MGKEILSELNERLKDRSIPSKLSEDKELLTVLFELEDVGIEVFGDIFCNSFEADDKEGGLIDMEWEIMDMTPLPDEVHGNICIAAAMLNSQLPLGGFSVRVPEDGESAALMYRVVLPTGNAPDKEWLSDQVFNTVEMTFGVLSATAGYFKEIEQGEMDAEKFLGLFRRK